MREQILNGQIHQDVFLAWSSESLKITTAYALP